MFEYLWVLVFVIEVDWLEAFGAVDRIVDELCFSVAVWFSDWDFVHDAADFLLGVSDLIETDVKDHSSFWEFIAFLADFEKLVVLVELFSRVERFEDDASFGVAAEGGTQMSTGDVVYFFNDHCTCSEGELELEFYEFPLIWALLDFGIFF